MTATPTPTGRFGEDNAGPRPVPRFGRRGSLVGVLAVVAIVAGLISAVAYGHATAATHPRLFGGSLVLDDQRPLTVVNLATGQVTVQLAGVSDEVGASSYGQVQAVAAQGGTWLVNRVTGTFNLLAQDNYVADPTGGGVGLGDLPGATAAAGYAVGADAYIVRQAPASTVSLVDPATVAEGARASAGTTTTAPTTIAPRGFARLPGQVVVRAGSATVAGESLWTLVTTANGCSLVQLTPTSRGHQGLLATTRTSLTSCATASLASAGGVVGLLSPGRVDTWGGPGGHRRMTVPATGGTTATVPATGSTTTLWYLVRSSAGWSALGVTGGRRVSGPRLLRGIPVAASPAAPVLAAGRLFSLDQAGSGQPDLWVIDPGSGAVGTVAGVPGYPAKSAAEQATFTGAEVVVSGPRVVYNNPASLLAVVVFTDGSHPPVVIDKSSAVVVTASGPATITTIAPPHATPGRDQAPTPTTTAPAGPAPAAPAINQQVSCATTTEKPYAPQVTGVVPASETARVAWSYEALALQDCQPDSWSVTLTAVGAPQPADPVQTVNGQQQLDVSGLRPSTVYRAVVTAYINKQSTASQPVTFTTRQQGPDAPASVRTTVDANGDWVVTWSPCRQKTCYVPADQWTVTGSACGPGYVGAPPTTTVSGGVYRATFSADALGLLGQSLSFQVQGSLADGLQGNPRGDARCSQSWRAPHGASITLSGAGQVAGQTITAHLQVQPPTSDAAVYGSLHTQFVYRVGPTTVGPTTSTSVSVPGLAPNSRYVPEVTVVPVGHPSAAVTVVGHPFRQNLAWSPALALVATPHVDPDPNTGTVDAVFPNLAGGAYQASGAIVCGSVSTPVSGNVQDGAISLPGVDLDTTGGDCALTLTLHDTSRPDPYGVDSPPLRAAVNWGAAPADGFTAAYTQDCTFAGCTTMVHLTADSHAPLGGVGWSVVAMQAHPGLLSDCKVQQTYPQAPTDVTLVIRGGCPSADSDPLSVTVAWRYFGQGQSVDAAITGQPGSVPTTTTTTLPPSTTTTSTTTTTTTIPTSTSSTTGSSTTSSPTTAPSTTLPSTTLPPTSSTAAGAAAAAGPTGPGRVTGPTALAGATSATPAPGSPDGAGTAALVGILAAIGGVGLLSAPLRRRRRRAGGKEPR